MATPNFKEITDASFDEEVTNSKGIVFLEFYRDSCSSCRVFESTLNEIENLYRGQVTFLRLNTDHGGTKNYTRLNCIGDPTCFVFYNGELQGNHLGACMTKYFQPILQQIFNDLAICHKVTTPLPVRH